MIADVGNQEYYLRRAKEFIACAEHNAASNDPIGKRMSKQDVQDAARLLVLWIANEDLQIGLKP